MNLFRIVARCICKKITWAFLVTLSACGLMMYTHSYRAGIAMLGFSLLFAFAVFEECQEADIDAQTDQPAPIRISSQEC